MKSMPRAGAKSDLEYRVEKSIQRFVHSVADFFFSLPGQALQTERRPPRKGFRVTYSFSKNPTEQSQGDIRGTPSPLLPRGEWQAGAETLPSTYRRTCPYAHLRAPNSVKETLSSLILRAVEGMGAGRTEVQEAH
jgi:hypothetical protein